MRQQVEIQIRYWADFKCLYFKYVINEDDKE